MCDVIKIRLKRRNATSGKGNQPLNIKLAVERPILKLGKPIFRWSCYIILLFRCFLCHTCHFPASFHYRSISIVLYENLIQYQICCIFYINVVFSSNISSDFEMIFCRNLVYCSWSTNNPPTPYFFCSF